MHVKFVLEGWFKWFSMEIRKSADPWHFMKNPSIRRYYFIFRIAVQKTFHKPYLTFDKSVFRFDFWIRKSSNQQHTGYSCKRFGASYSVFGCPIKMTCTPNTLTQIINTCDTPMRCTHERSSFKQQNIASEFYLVAIEVYQFPRHLSSCRTIC